ncbi:MAG: hypothetical protein HUJ30_03760 [Gammaproteobacteria bacterium]|nr:hypothetical protein [Gammaproteobacteria bacterium]
MQLVQLDGCNAVSMNGVEWGLYLTDRKILDRDNFNSTIPFYSPEIKYGVWSKSTGLSRSPLIGTVDGERVERLGQAILQYVREYENSVPFKQDDHFEAWLLDDSTNKPVALLQSVSSAREIGYLGEAKWRPGQLIRAQFHSSAGLTEAGSAAEAIQSSIQKRCSAGRIGWFERNPNHHDIYRFEEQEQVAVAVDTLPYFPVTLDWQAAEQQQLIQAYLDWLSPWLLLDQHIPLRLRHDMIPIACKYVDRLYAIKKLLPESICRDNRIKVALVQAAISA